MEKEKRMIVNYELKCRRCGAFRTTKESYSMENYYEFTVLTIRHGTELFCERCDKLTVHDTVSINRPNKSV